MTKQWNKAITLAGGITLALLLPGTALAGNNDHGSKHRGQNIGQHSGQIQNVRHGDHRNRSFDKKHKRSGKRGDYYGYNHDRRNFDNRKGHKGQKKNHYNGKYYSQRNNNHRNYGNYRRGHQNNRHIQQRSRSNNWWSRW